MSFPTSPTNGQTATVNGITYTYASATRSWRRSTLANVTADVGTFVTKVVTANLATGPINANGAVTVSSLASNGAVSGTTGTFTTSTTTSALYTGTIDANATATVNALTSNGAVSGTTFTTGTILPSANNTSNIGNTAAYYSNVFANTYNVGTGGIVNLGANATGNIGSSTHYFNTVFAQSTSALYADLAEVYQ